MKKYYSSLLVAAIMAATLNLTACNRGGDKASAAPSVITVEKQANTSTLYFSGDLEPNKQVNVTALLDGTVVKQNFQFGEMVQKGQLLFELTSSKQQTQFETDLTAYLKAKEDANSNLGKMQSTLGLYKKGLVSREENEGADSAYYLSHLALVQAQAKLQDDLANYHGHKDFFSLSIADTQSVAKALLNTRQSNMIKSISPVTGVALFPIESASAGGGGDGDSSGDNKVQVGGQVKEGQVLVTVGLLKGMAMKAQANEVDIDKLKVGLKANVTSVAFPGIILHGSIQSIASQATDSNSIPEFNLKIVIPKLTPQQLKIIKVGMSAKAAVDIDEGATISIPIAAVFQEKGKDMVTQVVNGQHVDVTVVTGATSESNVTILSGLTPGDKIVASH